MYENDPIAANWLKDYNAHIRLNLCWKFFGAIDIDFVDDSHYEGLKQRHDDACDKRMKRLFAINHQGMTYDEIENRLSEPLYPYDLPAATCQDLLKEDIWVKRNVAYDTYFNRCVVFGLNTLLGGNYFPTVMSFLNQVWIKSSPNICF